MANQTDVAIIEEGWRNAMVRITGLLDTSDLSLTPVITTAMFTNNDSHMSALTGFRVDRLQYAVDSGAAGLKVALYWNASVPQLLTVLADSNNLSFKESGGLCPNAANPGYDGSINLVTKSYSPGTVSGFTVTLSLIKLYRV